MDLLCGVLQPSAIPDWVGKIGPGIALVGGFLIYALNRIHAIRDFAAKREVVHSLLREHVSRLAGHIILKRQITTERMSVDPERSSLRSILDIFALGWPLDRLIELQSELATYAKKSDADIAVFIESCRSYERRHRNYSIVGDDPEGFEIAVECYIPVLAAHLEELEEKGRRACDRLRTNTRDALTGKDLERIVKYIRLPRQS